MLPPGPESSVGNEGPESSLTGLVSGGVRRVPKRKLVELAIDVAPPACRLRVGVRWRRSVRLSTGRDRPKVVWAITKSGDEG